MKTQVLTKAFSENAGRKKQKKYRIRKKVILAVIIGILMGFGVDLLISQLAGEETLWMPFGYGAANVLSESMEPTFSEGTLLFIKETKNVSPGDIVVYQAGTELIVHRVVAAKKNTIVTKGDANSVCDEPFCRTALKGKVIGWIPYLGTIVNTLEILVIVFAAGIFIRWMIQKITGQRLNP